MQPPLRILNRHFYRSLSRPFAKSLHPPRPSRARSSRSNRGPSLDWASVKQNFSLILLPAAADMAIVQHFRQFAFTHCSCTHPNTYPHVHSLTHPLTLVPAAHKPVVRRSESVMAHVSSKRSMGGFVQWRRRRMKALISSGGRRSYDCFLHASRSAWRWRSRLS